MSLRGAEQCGYLIINNMVRLPRCARNDNFTYECAVLLAVVRLNVHANRIIVSYYHNILGEHSII